MVRRTIYRAQNDNSLLLYNYNFALPSGVKRARLFKGQTRNDWLHLPRMITSEHSMHLKQVHPSESLPHNAILSSYLDFIIKNIDHPKRIVCFRQISKNRKKTPKFADFLHFEEFSFGFVEDKYKCSNFLLTEICSIPLPTYAKDE